jgi:hypothetical protein
MKKIIFYSSFVLFSVFINAQESSEKAITTLLNNWHTAAATANFNAYFDALTEDSIFIGTDATEHWDKKAFIVFAKPYFDKGKAWSFKALDRHVYFSTDRKIAWFDELLQTQMKICRGSGVLVLEKNQWKIKQYVLSMTIPNENTDEVIKIKAPIEDALISKLQK